MVPPKEKSDCVGSRKLGGHMIRPLMPLPLPCQLRIQEGEGGNTEMLRRTGIACHLKRLILCQVWGFLHDVLAHYTS
jgi:hypothetical protein